MLRNFLVDKPKRDCKNYLLKAEVLVKRKNYEEISLERQENDHICAYLGSVKLEFGARTFNVM